MACLVPGLARVRVAGQDSNHPRHAAVREGKTDSALEDLLACHRLGRLIGQGPLLLDGLVGCKLEQDCIDWRRQRGVLRSPVGRAACSLPYGSSATAAAAGSRGTSRCGRALRSWIQRPPWPATARTAGAAADAALVSVDNPLRGALDRHIYDWNEVLRMGNDFYDRMVAAARKPTRTERLQALKALNAEIEAMVQEGENESIIKAIAVRRSRAPIWLRRWERVCWNSCGPQCEQSSIPRKRPGAGPPGRGFARAGRLPCRSRRISVTVVGLCPKYLPKLPKDPFSKGNFRYLPRGEAVFVYSVGPNGMDDGGMARGPVVSKRRYSR